MFITEEEYSNLSREVLDRALERVYNKAIETTLKMMPDVIVGLTIKTKGIQTIFEDFKEKYPDLVGREAEILDAVQSIELEDGSKDLSEILIEAAQRLSSQPTVPKEQPQTVDEVERLINGIL
jgi:PHP family Zn ribbon phosphoesterase